MTTAVRAGLDLGAAEQWLFVLHGDSPGLISICSTGDWRGMSFDLADDNGGPAALDYIQQLDAVGREGIYLRATTVRQAPAQGRGTAADSLAFPGFWADLDIAGPGHAEQNLPRDEDEASAIIRESGLPEPTLWVHSGGGLYPWWLLDRPLVIGQNLPDVQAMSEAWQRVIGAAADRLGLKYGTGVHDLARVLRIPGTVNRKAGLERPCRMFEQGGRPYAFQELRDGLAHAVSLIPAPTPRPAPRPVSSSGNGHGDLSPFDDFEARTDWADILEPAGWTLSHQIGRTRYWCRPGKDRRDGHSASTGLDAARDRLFVFSTSVPELNAQECHTKQFVYAAFNHGGDLKAAARDLLGQGFGSRMVTPVVVPESMEVRSAAAAVEEAAEPTGLKPFRSPGICRVDIGDEQKSIGNIIDAIESGCIPDLYTKDGGLVTVSRPADGAFGAFIETVTVDVLRRLLSKHCSIFRLKYNKKDETFEEISCSPAVGALRSIVTQVHWQRIPRLAGLVTAPVMRPDGTILQAPGYDPKTGLYFDPSLSLEPIPDSPNGQQVDEAKSFVMDHVLGDFPWASPASAANFMALLMTPIMRPFVGGLSPMGAISATERGSGKTLLANLIGSVHGMMSQSWLSQEEELRKSITSALSRPHPVVLFDNVGESDKVDSPNLAKLLTSQMWDGRILGTNTMGSFLNDRLWLVTGNSLELGGDIPQRAVMVRLDAKCPRPDLRSGFRIRDLESWLEEPENRAKVLRSLLVLARGWVCAGAQEVDFPMRGFRRWASAMAGLTEFMGLEDFLGNADEMEQHDGDTLTWAAFLDSWYQRFGEAERTANDLRKTVDTFGPDTWAGTFITKSDGTVPSVRGLGMILSRRRGRFFGKYVLNGRLSENTWKWSVSVYEPPVSSPAPAEGLASPDMENVLGGSEQKPRPGYSGARQGEQGMVRSGRPDPRGSGGPGGDPDRGAGPVGLDRLGGQLRDRQEGAPGGDSAGHEPGGRPGTPSG